MKRWLSIGLVAVAACASAACGDDKTTTTGSAGSGGTGGSTGTGGSGGGGDTDAAGDVADPGTVTGCTTTYAADKIDYTGTVAPKYTCDGMKSTTWPNGLNSCRNDSDCAIINTDMVRALVTQCALGCRTEPPDCPKNADCNTGCVKMATEKIMAPGLSDACGKCYTDVAICSTVFCLSSCAAGPDTIGCVKCQFENGCRVAYERCSGLDRK